MPLLLNMEPPEMAAMVAWQGRARAGRTPPRCRNAERDPRARCVAVHLYCKSNMNRTTRVELTRRLERALLGSLGSSLC